MSFKKLIGNILCKHKWEVLSKETIDGGYRVISRCSKCSELKKDEV